MAGARRGGEGEAREMGGGMEERGERGEASPLRGTMDWRMSEEMWGQSRVERGVERGNYAGRGKGASGWQERMDEAMQKGGWGQGSLTPGPSAGTSRLGCTPGLPAWVARLGHAPGRAPGLRAIGCFSVFSFLVHSGETDSNANRRWRTGSWQPLYHTVIIPNCQKRMAQGPLPATFPSSALVGLGFKQSAAAPITSPMHILNVVHWFGTALLLQSHLQCTS
eukprot:361222-Chlamydomonas_euryale.AAC.3